MNASMDRIGTLLADYVPGISAFLVVFIFGLIVRRIIVGRLKEWTGKTTSRIDDALVSSIGRPMIIWIIILAAYAGLEVSDLSDDIVATIEKFLFVLLVFSISLALANLAAKFIDILGARHGEARSATSLTKVLARILVLLVGILVILSYLGVSITPMIATLGVSGLAVALALQDTLANLFAGIHISAAQQIRVGDYLRLESGEEGYVIDIGWRSTRIRMLPNNIIIVPNDRLAKAIITNYHFPSPDLAVLVKVQVHYKSDLEKVEKATVEVAREVMREVKGAVPEFEPFIRFNEFGESAVIFTAILRAREFSDQFIVRHEFIKRLKARFDKENIVIPFPIRAVNYEQEKER